MEELEFELYGVTADQAHRISKKNAERDDYFEIKKMVDLIIEDQCHKGFFDVYINFGLEQYKNYNITEGLLRKLRDDLKARKYTVTLHTNSIDLTW